MRTTLEVASELRPAIGRLSRRLRQTALDGVTPSQLAAMATLYREGPMTLGRLAAAERVRPPTVTRMVDALEGGGLILRLSDPLDRRVCRVALTARGKRLLEKARSAADRYLAERLAILTPVELETVEAAAGVLRRLVEEEPRAETSEGRV